MVFVGFVTNASQTWSSCLHRQFNSDIAAWFLRSHFFRFNYHSRSQHPEEREIPEITLSCFPSAVFFKAPTCQNEETFTCTFTRAVKSYHSQSSSEMLICWFERSVGLSFPTEWLKNTFRACQWSASVALFWSGTHYFHYSSDMLGSFGWNATKNEKKKKTDERIKPFAFARCKISFSLILLKERFLSFQKLLRQPLRFL